MAALVQTIPQQTTAIMIQNRSPTAKSFQNPQGLRSVQRMNYNPPNGGSYRNPHTVAPYAFTSTPGLGPPPPVRIDSRQAPNGATPPFHRLSLNAPGSASSSSRPGVPLNNGRYVSQDDMVLAKRMPRADPTPRPKSAMVLTPPINSEHGQPIPASSQEHKHHAERYRRRHSHHGNSQHQPPNRPRQKAHAYSQSTSAVVPVRQIYNMPGKANSSPSLQRPPRPFPSHHHHHHRGRPNGMASSSEEHLPRPPVLTQQMRKSSMDDIYTLRKQQLEKANKIRRDSVQSLDDRVSNKHRPGSASSNKSAPDIRGSTGPAVGSAAPSISRRASGLSNQTFPEQRPTSARSSISQSNSNKAEMNGRPASAGVGPTHGNSGRDFSDPRRQTGSSPLARPSTSSGAEMSSYKGRRPSFARFSKSKLFSAADASSPKQEQEQSREKQELDDVDSFPPRKGGLKSRLRRALSFGSVSELRRAAVESRKHQDLAAERARLKKAKDGETAQDTRDAEVTPRPVSPGSAVGGIYSSQGSDFQGSTDNFSISSTASSASLMLRKMGKSMRRTSRSFKGIFRNSQGLSISDLEDLEKRTAQDEVHNECEVVNVNYDVSENPAGETDYPRLERNSIDATSASLALESADTESVNSGRRTVRSRQGSEKRDGSSMPKGILKRPGQSESNTPTPMTPTDDSKTPDLTGVAPLDTPSSSRPSTPASITRRADNVAIYSDDYFNSPYSENGDRIGETPMAVKFNVSFNAKLQFHETWPSMEYDRRGEIATCNRLTPMLAQQIKEELNTFKMVSCYDIYLDKT
jgi:hypothetical protein